MSLYEALAVVALLGAGGFAWYLYRSDTRPTSGDPQGRAAGREGGESMFARPRDRAGDLLRDGQEPAGQRAAARDRQGPGSAV